MQRRVEMLTLLLASNGKVRLVATQTISVVMDEVLDLEGSLPALRIFLVLAGH